MFADGADLYAIEKMCQDERVKGFTTNPTLMRSAGVQDYLTFAKSAASIVYPRPISLEVFSDEFDQMERQANVLNQIRENVYVKIPVTNTRGESTVNLVSKLSKSGIKVNVTAVFTPNQVAQFSQALSFNVPSIISVFAGRIADSGVDPVPLMNQYARIVHQVKNAEILWASPREILNLRQAEDAGCDIITMTSDLWKKIGNLDKSLDDFSLETVRMFYNDARESGFIL
jgi:transaldolase